MSQEQYTQVAGNLVTIPGRMSNSRLVIKGRLPGLNEYTEENRKHAQKGAAMKRQAQELVMWHILSQIRDLRFTKPVFLMYTYYEPNRKRDHDNVSSFAHKVIQDALVQCGVLQGDGWLHVTGNLDLFEVDKNNPRIVVEFIEQEVAPACKKQPGTNSKK